MHSATIVSPSATAAKKLVLLSIVVVPALRQIQEGRGAAEIVGDRHHGAAMEAAIAVGQFLADEKLGRHLVARCRDNPRVEQMGERRLRVCDRAQAVLGGMERISHCKSAPERGRPARIFLS